MSAKKLCDIEIIEVGYQGPPGGGTTNVATPPDDDNSSLIANTAWVQQLIARKIAEALAGLTPAFFITLAESGEILLTESGELLLTE